jgi:hypothetical protein
MQAKVLTLIAWGAPIVVIPVYFFAVVGWGMSPSGPHASVSEILMLSVGPAASLAAIAKIISVKKMRYRALLFIPGLLSLAELAFTVLIAGAG